MDLDGFSYLELIDEQPHPGGECLFTAEYRGEPVYVTHTKDAIDSPVQGIPDQYLAGNLAADIVLRDLDIMPDQLYDGPSGRIIVEHAGDRYAYRTETLDEHSLIDSFLAKHLVNDTDIPGNILVDQENICHPIDFDFASGFRRTSRTRLYRRIIKATYSLTQSHNYSIDPSERDIEQRAEKAAHDMDFHRIFSGLEHPLLDSLRHRNNLFRALDWFHDRYSS